MDAVIFDFDGVIADSPHYYIKHMRKYFAALGIEILDRDILHLVGYPFSQKLQYMNKTYGLNVSRDEFIAKIYDDMNRDMHEKVKCPENLGSLLDQLAQKGVETSIASSNSLRNVMFYVEKFGLKEKFSHIVTLDHVGMPKPAPDAYIEVMKRLGKNPEKSVAIEDTVIGVESAKEAGLKAVAFPNEFTINHDFSRADMVIKNFGKLTVEKLEGLVK